MIARSRAPRRFAGSCATVVAALGAAVLASLASCAEQTPSAPAADDGDGADITVDAGADAPHLCPIFECPAPWVDCNDNPTDGCETNTLTDQYHCGGCNNACPTVLNGMPMCQQGVCSFTCYAVTGPCAGDLTTADCDGKPGCEAIVTEDPKNCGSCGNECADGVPCSHGSCGCEQGEVQCGDVCVDLTASAVHCGACGNACPDPDPFDDQLPRCNAGVCGLGCQIECGSADCDQDPATPCDPLPISSEHCGQCGNACPPGSACQNGQCCDLDKLDTDAENCGACGNDCTVGLRNKFAESGHPLSGGLFTAKCVGGLCVAECNLGFLDCDGDIGAAQSNGCETSAYDPSNCGACGHACLPGQPCVFGECATKPCDDTPPDPE